MAGGFQQKLLYVDLSSGKVENKALDSGITSDFLGATEQAADSDTVEEFNVHGDPAFNPYEPNHSG